MGLLLRGALFLGTFFGIKSMFQSEPTTYAELDSTHKALYWLLILTVVGLLAYIFYAKITKK